MTISEIVLWSLLVISWLVQWHLNDTKNARIEYLTAQKEHWERKFRGLDMLTDTMFDETDIKRAYHAGVDSVYIENGELRQEISGEEWLTATYRDPVQENKSIAQQLEEKLNSTSPEQFSKEWAEIKAMGFGKLIVFDEPEDYRRNEQYQEGNNPYQHEQFQEPDHNSPNYIPAGPNIDMEDVWEPPQEMKSTVDMEQYTQLEREYGHVSTSDKAIDEGERLYWESEAGKDQLRIIGKG